LFNERNVPMLSVEMLEPNLETVFLHLTGKSLRQ
jgi:ABC-2 type transport system ATP-binding protein